VYFKGKEILILHKQGGFSCQKQKKTYRMRLQVNHRQAKLFRAAAEAETVHAHNHLKELRGIKSTRENLETAIHGESHEFQEMYPQMIEEAKAEDNKSALRSFNYANAVEKVHADLYKKALEDIGKNKEVDYYVCQVCGFTAEETAPEKCPVCGSKKELFTHIG
jgi:rubrerythrin